MAQDLGFRVWRLRATGLQGVRGLRVFDLVLGFVGYGLAG